MLTNNSLYFHRSLSLVHGSPKMDSLGDWQSPETKRYCHSQNWLSMRQRKLCELHPDLIPSLTEGILAGIGECKRNFKDRRWNCPVSNVTAVFGPSRLRTSKYTHFIQFVTSWAKTNHCEKARWRPTVFWLREFFFTRKKINFYSEIWPKTYANALWADTLQFYASFVDFKCILEELTASWWRKWVDGELTASSRTHIWAYIFMTQCDSEACYSIKRKTQKQHHQTWPVILIWVHWPNHWPRAGWQSSVNFEPCQIGLIVNKITINWFYQYNNSSTLVDPDPVSRDTQRSLILSLGVIIGSLT